MKPIIVVSLLFSAAFSILAQETLPVPWKHQDINAAQVPGTAEHAAGVFTLQGTMDIWGTADGSHIVWQPHRGDAELVACVAAMDNPGGVAHAKASLCIRESLAAGVRHVTICVTPTDGTQFLYRDTADGKTTRIFPDVAAQTTSVPKGAIPLLAEDRPPRRGVQRLRVGGWRTLAVFGSDQAKSGRRYGNRTGHVVA